MRAGLSALLQCVERSRGKERRGRAAAGWGLERDWKPEVTFKTQAGTSRKSCGGKECARNGGREAVTGSRVDGSAGGAYVGTGTAPLKGDRLPREVASLFLPPRFQGRGEASPVPASWKWH